jgi:site-specific DNA recombinase
MQMRCAIYARYSSDLQRAESIEDQVRVCLARAEREGWPVVKIFSDPAISGSTLIRPGIQALMQAMRAGSIDVVLTESLDRISRDQEHIAAFYKQASFARISIVTLAEGEVSELHVGLKGTMGALYLKDLAQKTKRGMEGRIRAGRSVGVAPFGYRITRRLSADGELERGLREIDPDQATVLRRIFIAYASGLSPRRIAMMLNQEGIPGPSGRVWYAGTIRGRPAYKDGLLRQPTYAGVLTWCRRSNAKDPVTGRLVRQINDPSELVTRAAPELRIIDQDLWDRVQARLAAESVAGRRIAEEPETADRYWEHRRPRYLLTGKVFCGCCGRSFAVVGKDYLGCPAAQNAGCRNTRRLRRSRLEAQVLAALSRQLMEPALVEEFIGAFNREWARLNAEAAAQVDNQRREAATLSRKIDHLVDAVSNGDRSPSLRARLAELEAHRDRIAADVAVPVALPPALHPGIADSYRSKVAVLRQAMADENDPAALEAARVLIEKVIIAPPEHDDDLPKIELIGDLAELLRAAGLGTTTQSNAARSNGVLSVFVSSVKAGPGVH